MTPITLIQNYLQKKLNSFAIDKKQWEVWQNDSVYQWKLKFILSENDKILQERYITIHPDSNLDSLVEKIRTEV